MRKIQYIFLIVLFNITTFAQVGIDTENPQGVFHIDGKSSTTTKNPSTGIPTHRQFFDDFVIKNTGATGIGTSPDNYAMLDVSASNMGILVPRVNLVSNTLDLNADGDNNVRNQPQGLLVYNIGTVLGKGYYFWNGSEWMAFDSSTAVLPVFDALACASTTLSPAGYTTGVSYIGNLRVPYRGGNGGPYQPGAPITVNGLTFTLRAGKLEYGEGELVFSVTGIPDSLLDFNVALTNAEITFLAAEQKCTATVKNQTSADIKNLVFAGPLVYTTDNERGGYHFVATSPDGKWSVRCFLPEGSNFSQANLQLRYNGSNADPASKDIISNTTYFYGPGHTTQNNQVRYPKNQWAGRDGTSNDLVIATGQTSKNFPSWHNPGV